MLITNKYKQLRKSLFSIYFLVFTVLIKCVENKTVTIAKEYSIANKSQRSKAHTPGDVTMNWRR